MTDAELLRLAQGGDCQAWQSLYTRCMSVAWPYAYALVKNREIAEEIVSEAMLALVRSLQDTDFANGCLYAWLRRVVRNKVCDYFRRNDRQDRLLTVCRSISAQNSVDKVTETPLEAEEARQQVLDTLGQLDHRQQHVLHLMYIENMSVRTIAHRMNQSEKSIESLLYRARSRFRTLFFTNTTEQLTAKTPRQSECSLKSHDKSEPQ